MSAGSAKKLRSQSFVVLAGILFFGYWGLAFALGESYPLSPLGMFSSAQSAATRVVVRRASGELAEVTAFEQWVCPETLVLQGVCSPLPYSAQDDRVFQYIRENQRSQGEERHHSEGEKERVPVELVRLIFRIRGPAAPIETETCSITLCTARPR